MSSYKKVFPLREIGIKQKTQFGFTAENVQNNLKKTNRSPTLYLPILDMGNVGGADVRTAKSSLSGVHPTLTFK